jgi:hypothetical protein
MTYISLPFNRKSPLGFRIWYTLLTFCGCCLTFFIHFNILLGVLVLLEHSTLPYIISLVSLDYFTVLYILSLVISGISLIMSMLELLPIFIELAFFVVFALSLVFSFSLHNTRGVNFLTRFVCAQVLYILGRHGFIYLVNEDPLNDAFSGLYLLYYFLLASIMSLIQLSILSRYNHTKFQFTILSRYNNTKFYFSI